MKKIREFFRKCFLSEKTSPAVVLDHVCDNTHALAKCQEPAVVYIRGWYLCAECARDLLGA